MLTYTEHDLSLDLNEERWLKLDLLVSGQTNRNG